MKFLNYLACGLLYWSAGAVAHSQTVDFSKEGPDALFSQEETFLETGKEGLLIPEKTRALETRLLPIEGGVKYRLQVTASVAGDLVVEENERAQELLFANPRRGLAAEYEVSFRDGEGQDIPPPGRYESRPGGFFLTREPHPYTAVFTAPPQAVELKVRFTPHGRDTRLHRFSLVPETKEETLNPNPDFRYGELSYSGWRPQREGRLYRRPDGKVVFVAGYGGGSPRVPLTGGKHYHVLAKGDRGKANLIYFNAEGGQMSSRHLLYLKPEGEETDFTPPEGVASCIFVFYDGAILHELRLTEAGAAGSR